MVGIINYGAGNIRSVYTSVIACGESVFLIESAEDFEKADIIILPGVGAFGDGMEILSVKDLISPLIDWIKKGKPFLGICLGLQMLFLHSEEGNCKGIAVIKGVVKRFNFEENGLKVPHMGWNRVKLLKSDDPLFFNIRDNQYFFFAHSYYVEPDDSSVIAGRTNYGIEFASFVKKDNVVGVQFHPEKSGDNGIMFMKNFLEGKWLR